MTMLLNPTFQENGERLHMWVGGVAFRRERAPDRDNQRRQQPDHHRRVLGWPRRIPVEELPMPRQRIHHSRMVYVFPNDFTDRLSRFQRESGPTWAEIARRAGTSDLNLRHWREGVRSHWRHLAGLLALAENLGLTRLFTDWTMGEETRGETAFPGIPPDHRRPQSGAKTGRLAQELRGCVRNGGQAGLSLLSIRWTIAI